MDLSRYTVSDPFFGEPWIDVDEQRSKPVPHRYVHGGFEGTATRFSFYFPDEGYRGRFTQPMEGGLGGHENLYGGDVPGSIAALAFSTGLGAYMVESNQGHIGSELCAKAGTDTTIYGYRASAECARFSKWLAEQHYGQAPHHGYIYGGSGGSGRASMCVEHVHDLWDGCLPFVGATCAPVQGGGATGAIFGTLYNAQRILGPKLADVVDALEPGGSGDPYAGLTTLQRQALYDLYREGFPRGAEWMIANPLGQIGLWAWSAELWYDEDPDYYDGFWTTPGHMGHDQPDAFAGHLIEDVRATVHRVVTAGELVEAARVPGSPEATSPWVRLAVRNPPDYPMAAVLDEIPGYLQGAGIRVLTGKAAGRQIWCIGTAGNTVIVDGAGEWGNARFADVMPGDEVLVDNRHYLAYSFRYRHVVDPTSSAYSHLAMDGRALYPQRPISGPPARNPLFGVTTEGGKFTCKVLTVQHTHDSSIYPRPHRWDEGRDAGRWVLRWTENAEHGIAATVPVAGVPVPTTRLIDYHGHIEQGLHDLVAWVEEGIVPAGSNGVFEPNGPVVLPATAAERRGIQPVVVASANGAARAEVKVGEPVTLVADAEVPPGAGFVIQVEWDFDGAGTFAHVDPTIDGTRERAVSTVTHTFSGAGEFFPCARVTSHRQGDVNAVSRRVTNLGRCRVVVG